MCTKTKYKYGCGHTFKIKEYCRDRTCDGSFDRFEFPKDGDCQNCRELTKQYLGSTKASLIDRGFKGLGRYGKELTKHERHHRGRSEIPKRVTAAKYERNALSPLRQVADRDWDRECSEREERLSQTSHASSKKAHVVPHQKYDYNYKYSPKEKTRHLIEVEEYDNDESDYEDSPRKLLPYELLSAPTAVPIRPKLGSSKSLYGSYDSGFYSGGGGSQRGSYQSHRSSGGDQGYDGYGSMGIKPRIIKVAPAGAPTDRRGNYRAWR